MERRVRSQIGDPKRSTRREVTILLPNMKIDHEPTKDDPIEYWVDWVGISWEASVAHIFETCDKLIKFRDQFKHHGTWGKAIEERLKLSQRSINMLITIGECKKLRKPKSETPISGLPASWGTLYEMTRLPNDVLETKLKSGEINPSLRRVDVEKMVREANGQSKPRRAKETNAWVILSKNIDKLCTAVLNEAITKGQTDTEFAAAEVSKDVLCKRLDQLLVDLKAVKAKH
jgi:hypothetical protein